MPELPEVETIRRDLAKLLIGDRIEQLEVRDKRLMAPPEQSVFRQAVLGQEWKQVSRKGKYLLVELASGWRIVFHLRMTGQLVLSEGPAPAGWRLDLAFASGRHLAFFDQRRFGEVRLLAPNKSWHSANLPGPDALEELDRRGFATIVRKRTTRIHPLLMDQRLIAGVGNIYSQEALFKALIRPSRPGNLVTKVEADRLFDALRETLLTAIEHRGSSSRNYRDAYGQSGSAQRLHAVYRRGGKPCPRCQAPLRATRVGGRGTVFCPRCQR